MIFRLRFDSGFARTAVQTTGGRGWNGEKDAL